MKLISLSFNAHGSSPTFVQVKSLDAIKKFKDNINWQEVFKIRNWLSDLYFNPSNPNFVDLNQDIENELVINL